jgi:signal transduction histidine kinase
MGRLTGHTPRGAYGIALLAAIGGLVVTALVAKPLAGPFFMFQFAAVVGAALYGGLAPGLLTMVLSGVGYYALFCAPTLQPHQAYRLASFVLVSLFFAALADRMRQAMLSAEEARTAAEAARTRAEAAERAAREIGAQQERLVSVVSHDLRSPLGAITVSAEALLQQGLSDRQARSLGRIVTSARRMESMIRDLLDFARARHGSGLPVRPQPARLTDICHSALEEVRTAHPGRAVVLDVAGDDSVMVDPARVEQVVSNLVVNALKHGAADEPVKVRVTGDGGGVRLDVTNQGAPIPQWLVPTLFDPFRPGDAAGSVGLGLFIVSEIARAHGGDVAVRSDELGTTFGVTFPKDPATRSVAGSRIKALA